MAKKGKGFTKKKAAITAVILAAAGTAGFFGWKHFKGGSGEDMMMDMGPSETTVIRTDIGDFIYAIIVEELGVITGVAIILAYIIILLRILLIGRKSPSNRGATICYGVAAYIFFHIAINLMGILGLIPITGVPLPFMSYGGSFTICLIAALAMVQRVSVENGILKEKSNL